MTMPDQMNAPPQPPGHAVFYEEGAATEDPPDDPNDPFPGLPPGVHPMDPSTPGAGDAVAARPDTFGNRAPATGRQPWSTDNSQAVPVYQRGDHDWSANQIVCNAGSDSGSVKAVGRVAGRRNVKLWVPAKVWIAGALTTTPAGVCIGPSEAEVLNEISSVTLNPGDPLLVIDTEASIWVGLLPGQTVGYVYVVSTFNPPGGGIGGD